MLMLHTHYKNGFLPRAGGLLDQSAVFMRAMDIIEQQIAESQRDNAKDKKKRRK